MSFSYPPELQPVVDSFGKQKFMQLIGAEMTALSHGSAEITLYKREDLIRPAGMFTGGILSAIADTCAGYAASSSHEGNVYLMTVEFKINYLSPAIGEKIICRSKIIKNGKTLMIADCNIYAVSDKIEKHCATALFTMMRSSK